MRCPMMTVLMMMIVIIIYVFHSIVQFMDHVYGVGHIPTQKVKLKFKSRRFRKVNFPDHRKQFIINWDHFDFIHHSIAIDKHFYMCTGWAKKKLKIFCRYGYGHIYGTLNYFLNAFQIDFYNREKSKLFIWFNNLIKKIRFFLYFIHLWIIFITYIVCNNFNASIWLTLRSEIPFRFLCNNVQHIKKLNVFGAPKRESIYWYYSFNQYLSITVYDISHESLINRFFC